MNEKNDFFPIKDKKIPPEDREEMIENMSEDERRNFFAKRAEILQDPGYGEKATSVGGDSFVEAVASDEEELKEKLREAGLVENGNEDEK